MTGEPSERIRALPLPVDADLLRDARVSAVAQRLDGIRDAFIALQPSPDKILSLVVDWPTDGPRSQPPFERPGGDVHPMPLHSPSNVQVVPWFYNWAKKEMLGTTTDLHLTALCAWNADIPTSAKAAVVDLLAGCMSRLDTVQALNARRGHPDGQHGLALWSESRVSTSVSEHTGVKLEHTVRATIVSAAAFNARIMSIVQGRRSAFAVVQVNNNAGWPVPQWLHQQMHAYFKEMVSGSGVGVEFASYFSAGSVDSPFHMFFVDFPVAGEIMRLSTPVQNNDVATAATQAVELARLEVLYPNNPTFVGAARQAPYLNQRGVWVANQDAVEPDVGASLPRLDKPAIMRLSKDALVPLLSAPFKAQRSIKQYKRAGRTVCMEAIIVGHRTAEDAASTRQEWFPEQGPPVEFPTSSSPETEWSYHPCNDIMHNVLPKDLSTLLRFVILSCPRINGITMSLREHYAGTVKVVAFLFVGFKDNDRVNERGLGQAIRSMCRLGIPEGRWGIIRSAGDRDEPLDRGPAAPAEVIDFWWTPRT